VDLDTLSAVGFSAATLFWDCYDSKSPFLKPRVVIIPGPPWIQDIGECTSVDLDSDSGTASGLYPRCAASRRRQQAVPS